MQRMAIILFIISCISCKKDSVLRPYSVVNVKFIEDEEYVFMETVEGSYDKDLKLAQLNATGYKLERFGLYLNDLTDTGYYSNPSIRNISFTNGLDFLPYRLNSGYIHIIQIDSFSVRGDFKVTLEDDFNGAEIRTIVGGFGINIY